MRYSKKIFCLITILLQSLLTITASTIEEDSNWRILNPSKVSPDGKWLLYYKKIVHNSNSKTAFLINTETKQQHTIHDPAFSLYKGLLNDNYIVMSTHKAISIVDLLPKGTTQTKENIKQYDVEPITKILFTLDEQGQLNIQKLNRKGHQTLFEVDNVSKFFLNKSKTYLVYQDNTKDKNIYKLDLKTFKKSFLSNIKQDIQSIQWNIDQDVILFDSQENNNLYLINLKDNSTKEIQIPKGKLTLFEKHFYANNDLLLTYNIQTDEIYPESTYLDMWTSNGASMLPSNFKAKHKFSYVAKIYSYETEQQIDLERGRQKEYFPITIPGFVVTYDPTEGQDFLDISKLNTYYIENVKTKQRTFLTKIRNRIIHASPDNTKLLYQKENSPNWIVFNPVENSKIIIDQNTSDFSPPSWSTDSKSIYYINNSNLVKLDFENLKKKKLTNFKSEGSINVINDISAGLYRKLIDNTKPIVIKVRLGKENAIFKLYKNKVTTISPYNPSPIQSDYVQTRLISENANVIIWSEQDYNLPPTIFMHTGTEKSLLVKSEISEELYNWQKRKIITFQNREGTQLEGYLFYPKNFDPSKKYPMVTNIYTKAWSTLQPYDFISPTYFNPAGHNRTLLNELGYFVFTPDTYVDERGPGLATVDCVERAIKQVLKEEASINKDKIGISGFSFGGYGTSFIVTHTDLFAAAISGAGIHDLIGSFTYKYNNERKLPEYARIEGPYTQFKMKQNFAENPQKYYDNSPLLHAHKVKTPILLFTGLLDENVHWEQTRTMFWALKRYNNTEFVALFYNEIGHVFNIYLEKQKVAAKDFTIRNLDWWDYYLKDNKSIQWIDDAVNPTKSTVFKGDYN